ncbi:MAG: flagellar motor protein [Candidatus Gastranaerophilales bacterium]|jgi:chemotaxis protein MotA|nr:flagellar motor protein [Candidatus Gastranaerophilales bacterium]
MDITSIFGIFFGIFCILLGQMLEGGNMQQLMQVTAAFIVFGGTGGAVILSFPLEDIIQSLRETKLVFLTGPVKYESVIEKMMEYAQKARKEGIISLESDAKNETDPLLKMGLEAVADGADPALVKDMLETFLSRLEEQKNGAAKVWESFGGYSPTIGIIGAVLGLIQVMQNLSDPSKLGAGIAVAFVATVYGVGAANLIAIPMSTKIKLKAKQSFVAKEMMIEGILAIQAGESPTLIERKLNAYIVDAKPKS